LESLAAGEDDALIVAFEFTEDGWAFAVSRQELLDSVDIQEGDVLGFDGNPDHARGTTVLALGVVPNASRNQNRHSLSVLAIGAMSGGESRDQTLLWLGVVARMLLDRGIRLPTDWAWLLDGSAGFRTGLADWDVIRKMTGALGRLKIPPAHDFDDVNFEKDILVCDIVGTEEDECEAQTPLILPKVVAHTMEEIAANGGTRRLTIAMCWFHVSEAIRQHTDRLPRGRHDAGKMCYEVGLLADMRPDLVVRAWQALRAGWLDRGWGQFLEYLESTWVELLAGWNVSTHGPGTPRTQASLEGLWPSLHRMLGGRLALAELAQRLCDTVLPYLVARLDVAGDHRPALALLERQAAVTLALEPLDRLIIRKIDDVQWMYCHKRVLGSERPSISEQEVDDYEEILSKPQWSLADMYAVANMRKFNPDSCVCADNEQYVWCYHRRGAMIRLGMVQPEANERPDASPEGIRADRDLRQAINATTCYICARDCQNAFNLDAHMRGSKHSKAARKLGVALLASTFKSNFRWGKCDVERIQAKQLERGQIVFIVEEDANTAVQGVVSGKQTSHRKATVHVAISMKRERVLSGGQSMYRVDIAPGDDNRSTAKSTSQKTKPTQGRKTRTAHRTGTSSNPSKGRRPKKRKATTPPVEKPISKYEAMREKNIKRNKAALAALGIPQAKKALRPGRTRGQPAKSKSHHLYKAGYWLSAQDLTYGLQATNVHEREITAPMAWDMLIQRLVEIMQEESFGKWETCILNTDDRHSVGIHWILALWSVLATLVVKVTIWEPYGHTRHSAHIVECLKRFEGVEVIIIATGIQLCSWRCGYICFHWQLMVHALLQTGQIPDQWEQPDTYDDGWEDFVWGLCRIMDLQHGMDEENAKTIGIRDELTDALDTGRLAAFSRIKRIMSTYEDKLVRMISIGLPSWHICVRRGVCTQGLGSPMFSAGKLRVLVRYQVQLATRCLNGQVQRRKAARGGLHTLWGGTVPHLTPIAC
jgi:hypothetical protein